MEFKDRLKQLRNEKGILQKELAVFIGVSRTTVVRWENGGIEPNIKTLIKLAEYFECSVDYLIGVVDKKNTTMGIDIAVNDLKNLDIKTIKAVYDFVLKMQN